MRLAKLFVLLLVPACAPAPDAIGASHVWRQSRTFEPLSTTASSITGTLGFSEGALVFDGDKTVAVESLGLLAGAWGDADEERTAEVFRMASDPGVLRNGNALCSGAARYAVFYEDDTVGPSLNAAFFESQEPPGDISSDGLCGTFSYIID